MTQKHHGLCQYLRGTYKQYKSRNQQVKLKYFSTDRLQNITSNNIW